MLEALDLRGPRMINGRGTAVEVDVVSERQRLTCDDDRFDSVAESDGRTDFYVTFSDSETGRISDLYVFPHLEHRFDVEAILEEYGTKVGCNSMAVIYFGENGRWCWETYDFRTHEL